MPNNDFYHYTYDQFLQDCKRIAAWGKDKNFTGVYGIPRGGLAVALWLSHMMNAELILKIEDITPRTLVVDDITDTGATMKKLLGMVLADVKTATLFYNIDSDFKPGFYCRRKGKFVKFPWETEKSAKYDYTDIK